jgi:hypothetical protein
MHKPKALRNLLSCGFAIAAATGIFTDASQALQCSEVFRWDFVDDEFAGLPEYKLRDGTARAAVERLDGYQYIVRGRVKSVRGLDDESKTQTPSALVVFEDVDVLKGELPAVRADGKVYLNDSTWCDGPLYCAVSKLWKIGEIAVIGAYGFKTRGDQEISGTTKDGIYHVVYKGRVDLQMGACFGGRLGEDEIKMLNASKNEIERLMRQYPRRFGTFEPPAPYLPLP